MDVVSLGFLILVVLVGGVIALIADNLGRTLGKKRLKFLHLRPRHTAMLFTAIAGLAIPLITVVLVATVSSDVRQWILEGRKAIADVKVLENQKIGLQNEIDRGAQDMKRLESARSQSAKENLSIKAQSSKLKEQIGSTLASLSSVRADFGAARRTLDRTLSDLGKSRQELGQSKRSVTLTKSSLDSAVLQLNELNQRYTAIDRELQRSEGLVRELETTKKSLEAQIAKGREDFRAEQESNERELGQIRTELLETRRQVNEAREELKTLNATITALQTVNDQSRSLPIVYFKGDEVARIVVPANQSNSGSRNQLNRLLRVARVAAEARGAGGNPSVGFFAQGINPDDVASRYVAELGGKPEERVAVAIAILNSFRTERVAVTVLTYSNRKAFEKGEVIAEARIDGDQRPSQALAEISAFLAGPVKEKALARGMIPIAGAEAGLGSIEPGQVLDLVFQLVSQNRTARVQAIAEADIFSGDVLKISFRIK